MSIHGRKTIPSLSLSATYTDLSGVSFFSSSSSGSGICCVPFYWKWWILWLFSYESISLCCLKLLIGLWIAVTLQVGRLAKFRELNHAVTMQVWRPVNSWELKHAVTMQVWLPVNSWKPKHAVTMHVWRPVSSNQQKHAVTMHVYGPVKSNVQEHAVTMHVWSPVNAK